MVSDKRGKTMPFAKPLIYFNTGVDPGCFRGLFTHLLKRMLGDGV